MGGGDLNAKKAWHPNTLKNQERVWKAEQAAAEEKKRIVELERERLVERERAELNKLAKSSLAHSSRADDDRLHWMYEKPDKKVQQEEYLLGKAIDKNHQQVGKSEADEIPAVSRRVVGSSMLTVAGDTQVDLVRKMREDPLLLVKERERAARAALLNNPVQRARLAELLRKEQKTEKESKSKKKKKKSTDLDNILAEKLQALSGKQGIDLASLLASDDSSSDSSDEKSKRKKKKNKKKSKNKKDILDNNDFEEQTHKSKKTSNQKRESVESDSNNIGRKKGHHSIEIESTKSHVRRHGRHRDSSEDQQSSDDNSSEELRYKTKYGSKNELKKYNSSDKSKRKTAGHDKVDTKRKKRRYSIENESNKSHLKKHTYSSENDSSDYQQRRDNEVNKIRRHYVREDRYWNHKQYTSDYQKLKGDHYSSNKCCSSEGQSKKEKYSEDNKHKHEHEDRNRDGGSYRNSYKLQGDCKTEKDKGRMEPNARVIDKGWRNNKQSRLSEAEKASKLAEMVAAGAEREKQRERRVAEQLAEKETEDRPNALSRSRNVIRQLPDSLESRIHSNRHYIQRDQKHMNENFARR